MDMNEVFDPARDLTVVIPTYNRSQYFLQYLEEGRWDGIRIHMVCDGCDPEVVKKLREETAGHDVTLFEEYPNRGVAHAIGVGVRSVRTSHYMFCGDDDYNVDYTAFLEEAAQIQEAHDDVLFVTMPEIVAFGDGLTPRVQYDRRDFRGKTGRQLLEFLFRTGEMRALVAGSLFRTAEMVPLLPEPFFRVSEDFVLLARLCARHPDRRVYVTESGRRMRRIHAGSLSYRPHFSPEKALMNLVSMVVGGYYLEHAGVLHRAEVVRRLLNRGNVLQQSYGLGRQVAAVVAGLLLDTHLETTSNEARRTLDYLKDHRDELPPEFIAMLSGTGKATLAGKGQGERATKESPGPAPEGADDAAVIVVGGGTCTGTTLLETILCQAPTSNPKLPEAHYLRCLLAAYRLARGSVHHQVPQFFDDVEDFRRYNAVLVREFLARTRSRVGGVQHLVLKDPEMTKTFPELHELLPSARFVCMVRDPRDVVASLLNVGEKMLAQGRSDVVAQATRSRDLVALCRYYQAFYAPLWTVQDDRFWERILFVRYEDLVQDPEGILKEVQTFTGLHLTLPASDRFDTGTVDFDQQVHSPWYSELYGKQVTGSRVGAYATVLRPEEVRAVEQVCAAFMQQFQYVPAVSEQAA
ncbi:MAG: hypothetical protein KatS3mg044_0606 [Rhodothermaceae bacterium]|nr:MAG: hypothetical protein KatS3mg044_0606 [Rhodothermaceae bacterium]